MTRVSVLLPSRGRELMLCQSVHQLVSTASFPPEIEVLVAVDPDDEETAAACRSLTQAYGRETVCSWISPRRFGYTGMHHYVNFLAGQATGDWMMLWNDDARMVTGKWDDVIAGHDKQSVLWPQANHAAGGNLFPVWPSWWYSVLGYVSRSPNIDVWVSEIARRLGVEGQIPVEIVHDRPDVTGRPEDATHAEGRALMGQGNDPDYDSAANRAERARAVSILRSVYARRN